MTANPQGNSPVEREEFYESLRTRKAAQERQRAEERENRARKAELSRPAITTKEALQLAALGTKANPTGPLPNIRIDIDSASWARWIVDAGRAWKEYPGLAVLQERPLPDIGLGIEAGLHILELACSGASVEEVAAELNQARSSLGPREEGKDAINDTEVGILVFFRQMDRHFDGGKWSAPQRKARLARGNIGATISHLDEQEEQLRRIGVQCASLILANPEQWRNPAAWLRALPICQAVASSDDKKSPAYKRFLWRDEDSPNRAFYVYDDEEETARVLGPICRKLINGWDAAAYRFRSPDGWQFMGLKIEDAKRMVLLGALTLDADFDGTELGLGWSWEQPPDSKAVFEGRASAWAKITGEPGAESSMLKLLSVAIHLSESRTEPTMVQDPHQRDVVARNEIDGTIRLSEDVSSHQEPISHAADFVWLRAGGETFRFKKGQQASAIRTLYEQWDKAGGGDGCGLAEETIGDHVGSAGSSFRMEKLFAGHPAKGKILCTASKGVWALYLQNPRRMDTSKDS